MKKDGHPSRRKRITKVRGFDRYLSSLLEVVKKDLLPWIARERKPLSDALANHIFDLPGPTVVGGNFSGRQIHHSKIFKEFEEVSQSFDRLNDIEFYVGRFPFQNTTISRERYLQFHVESYLHEVYVLEQRLLRYLKVVERQFRNDSRLSEIRARCEILREVVRRALTNPVKLRGVHVHEERFSDKGLSRLRTIALLSDNGDDSLAPTMKSLYQWEHQKIKKHWKETIAANNVSTRDMLDTYFDELFKIVFAKSGRMQYPSRLIS